MSKAYVWVLRHTLYFKTKDAQFVHDPCNTARYHTKVLCTDKHTCGVNQLRKFLHCFLIPKLIVTSVIVIVVQPIEDSFVAVIETLVYEVMLYAYTWVEEIRFFTVTYKENVANKGI